ARVLEPDAAELLGKRSGFVAVVLLRGADRWGTERARESEEHRWAYHRRSSCIAVRRAGGGVGCDQTERFARALDTSAPRDRTRWVRRAAGACPLGLRYSEPTDTKNGAPARTEVLGRARCAMYGH